MKGGPYVLFDTIFLAEIKNMTNSPVVRQLLEPVSDFGVGFQRQYLAVDPKAPDAVLSAILQGPVKGSGIVQAYVSEVLQLLGPWKFLHILSRYTAKFNRFFGKDTTESKTDHRNILARILHEFEAFIYKALKDAVVYYKSLITQ